MTGAASTWWTPACTCSAPGIRCPTNSTTPTASRPTPCTASPASCWNCSNARARSTSRFAFDEALDSCFRNALYPAYKANRDPAPEELKRQFALLQGALQRARASRCWPTPRLRSRRPDRHAPCTQVRAHGHRRPDRVRRQGPVAAARTSDDEQWDYARNERWGARRRQGRAMACMRTRSPTTCA